MKRSFPTVLDRLRSVPPGDLCVSVVTAAELRYGVGLSPRHAQDHAAYTAFSRYVDTAPLGHDVAQHYAEIRADLKRRGTMIGGNDLFIAAHARALGVTLVTHNVAEFSRVIDLDIDDWTVPPRRRRVDCHRSREMTTGRNTDERVPVLRAPDRRPRPDRAGLARPAGELDTRRHLAHVARCPRRHRHEAPAAPTGPTCASWADRLGDGRSPREAQ